MIEDQPGLHQALSHLDRRPPPDLRLVVDGLVRDGADHADRVELEHEQDTLLEAQGRMMVRLPLLPEGTEGGGIAVLADRITGQGMV